MGGYRSAGCEVLWLEAREMVTVGYGGLRCDLRVEGHNSQKRNRTSSRGESAFCHGMAAMGSKFSGGKF